MKSRSHRLPAVSNAQDDWGDESWVVDCVCGVDFDDGEEMVDCDECGVWVHTRCSRYVKSEKLFACDKCKSKKLRKESEETEVAQLLVELPTKTLRMENPYSIGFPSQSAFQVCSEVPLEEKVHVQGIPGGDPALFNGVSSVFTPQLWKCTGYVPKKFNYQYREFPCWDNKKDGDDGNNKEKVEKHASIGADALFSLSKENGGKKAQGNNGLDALDMGPPSSDMKKQEVENSDGRRQQSGVRRERSSMKSTVIHTGEGKKDGSKTFKDQNRKKNLKSMEKDEQKRIAHASDSVPTTSSDAKQSESSGNIFKTDMRSYEHENTRAEVQTNHKSDGSLDNNNPLEIASFDDSRINPSKEAKQMEENDGNQVALNVEISNQTENGMASSLIHNHMESSTIKHEAGHEAVDDVSNNGRTYSRSNGTRSNKSNLEKVDPALSSEHAATVEIKSIEINQPSNTNNPQNASTIDLKLDNSKKEDDSVSASVEAKNEAIAVSPKVHNVDKTPLRHNDSKGDEPPCVSTQPKGQVKGSENPIRISSEGQSKSHKLTVVKSSAGKFSSKPSVPDKAKYSSTDVRHSSSKQKIVSEISSKSKKVNSTSSESPKNGDNTCENPKKLVRDIPKSSSTSFLKSSHSSKSSSHAIVSKKNSSDLKDSSADSANSSRSESGAHEQNKSTSELSVKGEKMSQMNRQPAPKNHPPLSASSAAALSDEELALLLHQELNSSPRVPRVPRMRQAGSLPQLASSTPTTSTLMKRTSTSGGKDNGLVSRKKNKDLSNSGSSNSREFDGARKITNSRRQQEPVKNGSAKTVSSGPSSSNEANENTHQNASDDETGVPAHRTLPGLIADIMSKGKRMTYEELCNAVLPHWPNLRKHNGERYAYSSHSQAVLDCLRNRSEWSRLVDRGPKTNAGRKRRKSDADVANPESEDEYSTDRNTKDIDSNDLPKGKQKTRKRRRLALQGRGIKDVRRRRKVDVVSDDNDSSSDSSEDSAYSDEEMHDGRTSGPNEASASSDETGTS
ncbi:hypothetical protein QVD17_01874 [Tagetes erecta]|uniref:Zinc finger PHD-type domain-containing protein n=1 Tax=Tagetes erecta TaxID=13708 RepID=A0AAD8P8B2_TARER|nr:hypothetical protein QVD17_01874 [Tagetes erecta]